MLHIFRGHTGAILSLAVNADELFSGSADRTAKCWSHKEDKLFWACHYGIVSIMEEELAAGRDVQTTDVLDRTVSILFVCLTTGVVDGGVCRWSEQFNT